MVKRRTPWLGPNNRPSTRPVKDSEPTAKQVAETVLQELHDPGYLVSFYDGDMIDNDTALRILSEAILDKKAGQESPVG